MATRIGPRMNEVLEHVKANPGCTKLSAALAVAPHGSTMYGYRTVDRAIRAGLIVAKRPSVYGKYALYAQEG